MHKTKMVLGSLAGAVAIHVAFLACGEGGMSAVLDGGVRDAHAQEGPWQTVRCDQVTVTAATSDGDPRNGTRTEHFYGVLPVAGLDPRAPRRIRAVACDRETFEASRPNTCASGYTCSENGFALPTPNCQATAPSLYAPGQAIFDCGSRQTSMQSDGASGTVTRVYGQRSFLVLAHVE